MPTLHLQLCAGFANRVRAMISGICLAEHLNIPLVLHWFPQSGECVCRFSSVLDPESLPKTVKVVPEDIYQAREVLSKEAWSAIELGWDKQSDIHIKSYSIFFQTNRYDTHLRNLRPSPMVRDFLQRRSTGVDWFTAVGVHIRRTDHRKSIEGSPLESFIQRMSTMPEAFFIVATDDKQVKEQIEKMYLGRCMFLAITLTRRTEEGMIQGVADFFALSKCSSIIGSTASSFSEMAARYGNIPLEIATL